MRLNWTSRARKDLFAISEYIMKDNATAARRWISRLRSRAEAIKDFPQAGRVVPETGREDVREVIVGNYRIIYHVIGKNVYVLTVLEGHRQLHLEQEFPPAVEEE